MLAAALLIASLPVGGNLARAEEALEAFDAQTAAAHLTAAKEEGPYDFASFLRLWELTAFAQAYLGNEAAALEAFATLLSLSPGHAVDYTLSPKVTFLFARARKRAGEHMPTTVDVTWPRGRQTGAPLPVTLDLVADPNHFVRRAELRWRIGGVAHRADVALSEQTSPLSVSIPAAPQGEGPVTIQVAATAYDARGNEVFLFADDRRPREIRLDDELPRQWYERWWVWVIAGTVVAASTGAGVYAATRGPPDTFDAMVRFGP